MKVLLSGGAGYVGSHAAKLLLARGHDIWIYDNLSEGHRAAVPAERLVEGDLHDQAKLTATLKEKKIEAVMHFAASCYVGVSVTNPAEYYHNNVVGTLSLLEAMRHADVKRIVFSSTCATYGVPDIVPITEAEKQAPINPYGFTKLVIERALADYAHAYGWGYAALRYFNAAGASPEGDIGEDHDPEADETATGDRAQFTLGEPVLRGPVIEDRAADGEADARRNQRHEAGKEQGKLVVHSAVSLRRRGCRATGGTEKSEAQDRTGRIPAETSHPTK